MTEALAIDLSASCWLWTRARDSHGYGTVTVRNRQVGAHRYMWTVMRGPIPKGRELHHLCGVRRCVNPKHMELLTRKEHKRRHHVTHCKHGHPFDRENTYVYPNGARMCRECNRRAALAWYHAHRSRKEMKT